MQCSEVTCGSVITPTKKRKPSWVGWVERSETQEISTDLVGFRSSTQPTLTGEAGEAGEPARSGGGIVLADLSAEVVNAFSPMSPGVTLPTGRIAS